MNCISVVNSVAGKVVDSLKDEVLLFHLFTEAIVHVPDSTDGAIFIDGHRFQILWLLLEKQLR